MREIVFILNQDGTISSEALGFKGKSCKEATEWLEKLLGEITDVKYKPEYYQKEAVKQSLRTGR